MEKTFSEILENTPWFSEEEARQLLQWASEFPYSQVLQVAVACAAWRFNWPDKQEWLQKAALHSANRSVLKNWIEKAQQEEPAPAIQAATRSAETTEKDLAEAIMADIESLHEAMKRFELLTAESAATPKVSDAKSTRPAKSKKERLLEAVRQLREEQSAVKDTPDPKEVKKKTRKRRPSENDALLKEIESRKQVEPENDKTKEQLEIIDRFIQSNPSISPQTEKRPGEPATDLTTTGQQPDFGEHIVSETLVEILIQQGKKDKAIEVLKKLIWKFPQKKTYFAARIDELKK